MGLEGVGEVAVVAAVDCGWSEMYFGVVSVSLLVAVCRYQCVFLPASVGASRQSDDVAVELECGLPGTGDPGRSLNCLRCADLKCVAHLPQLLYGQSRTAPFPVLCVASHLCLE